MTDATPLLRQWRLLKVLSVRRLGVSAKEMATEEGVSQKTVRRDLDLFRQIGFPLEEVVADHGRKQWRIHPTWTEPQTHFTFDEAIALYMARKFLEPLAGTPFWRAASNAFAKIRSSLSDSVIKYLERMSDRLHHTTMGAGNYAHKEELIDQLMLGIEDSRAVFITYQSLRATEPVTYDIFLYGITIHFGSLYLVGYHTDAQEIRTWKIDRMEDAEATRVPFQQPKDFSLAEHFASSFGVFLHDGQESTLVRIRFSPTVSRYVQESKWHDSQKLTREQDGWIRAEFQLSSLEEVKSWVLSFGAMAVVEEPAELRKQVEADARAIVSNYQSVSERGRGMYVALPTTATSNGMFSRVEEFVKDRYSSPAQRINLQLLHGRTFLSEKFEGLRLAAIAEELPDESAQVVAEEWFAKDKKQGLLAPFAVGTIDQALLSVLQTKFGFVRLFGLAGKTVILDEIHAYDAYTSTILGRMLAWLNAIGSPVVLLSATLPRATRHRLIAEYLYFNPAEPIEVSSEDDAKPYPRVTVACPASGRVLVQQCAADRARDLDIRLQRIENKSLADQLREALVGGGTAAVICNTVNRAQAVFQELRDRLYGDSVVVELFHARFPLGDRQKIEDHVLDAYGKGHRDSIRPARLLVATQVVEQSLDLDFDLMVTEYAPIDQSISVQRKEVQRERSADASGRTDAVVGHAKPIHDPRYGAGTIAKRRDRSIMRCTWPAANGTVGRFSSLADGCARRLGRRIATGLSDGWRWASSRAPVNRRRAAVRRS